MCVRPVLFNVFSLLLSLLFLSGEDVWSYAKKLPHLFQQGGVFYNIVKKDMGSLSFFPLSHTQFELSFQNSKLCLA